MQSIKTEICFLGFLLILMSCAGNLQEKASISAPPPGPVVSPFAGWDVGGGGDAYAAEFKDIGRTVVRRLKGKAVNEVLGISVTSFEDTLEMLKVETTEAVLKKGDVPVDALNYPTELKIELSLVHWAVSLDFFEKRRLVIHEILGLMKKDDSRYQLTTQVLEVLGAHRIYFNNFQILGEVAKTLIEKMPWQSDEMLTEAEFRGHVTTYRIPFDSNQFSSNKPDIECTKLDNVSFDRISDFSCSLKKYAYISEEGVIHVSLAEEDGNHALWRLFDSIEGSRFDYGVIRGDREKLLFKLQFFP